MSLFGDAKIILNRLLRPANVRVESLTGEKAETARLLALDHAGQFARPVFPVPAAFLRSDPAPVLAAIDASRDRFEEFSRRPASDDAYSLQNHYYTTPDAQVLHAMVRLHRPALVVEIGSGNSTLLFREAVRDAGLSTRIVSIDPEPRRSVERHADELLRRRVEEARPAELFARLRAGDILFIDSSHEIKPGNDVLYLLLEVLPTLAPGVLIHVHDIFLPYEYPRSWVVERRWNWTEQYLVLALLQGGREYEVLWAGHHLQRTLPDFRSHFPHWRDTDAASLWLRRT